MVWSTRPLRLGRSSWATLAFVWTMTTLLRGFSSGTTSLLQNVRSVYLIRRHRPVKYLQKTLEKLSPGVPVRQWAAVDGFDLQDDVLDIVDSGVVEPAALPRVLVKDEWRQKWRETKRWRHVRRGREAPGKKHGGWLQELDLTRGSLGQALSQLQVWADIEKEAGAASDAFLVVEDNCKFPFGVTTELLEDRLEAVPKDWDLVCLGGEDLLGTPDPELAQFRDHEIGPGLRRLYPWYRLGPAYLISGAGAKKALRTCTPLRWRLDCQLVGRLSSTQFGEEMAERLFAATRSLRGFCLSPPLASRPKKSSEKNEEEEVLTESLDSVVAWSMRLTDKPLPKGSISHIWHPDREIEGHSNMVPEAVEVMNAIASDASIKTVCEVGFNAGHSALRWLLRTKAQVYSFDLGDHPYARPAAMWLSNRFPGRLNMTWGDSLATVPEFHRHNPDVKCELIFIDGGHSYDVAIRDLKNFAALANLKNNRVLLDDTFLDDVRRAWDEMMEMGYVEELQSYSGEISVGSYGFTLGMYTEHAAELLQHHDCEMPREVITIQVGQCGNQIGCRFWDLVLREHAFVSKTAIYDAALSSFFRNVDTRHANLPGLPVGDQIRTLKARCLLVDMEEGVVNSLLTGPLADLFDARQRITDVSGSGNNWAHGYHVYGPTYRESIQEKVRKSAEQCDSLQCFFLLHSLGGGTGSGLGTYILESLEDMLPEVFRFVSCVCPSREDDVVTSPYNTILAMRPLIQSAHCVLPTSNDSLASICNQISTRDAGEQAQVKDFSRLYCRKAHVHHYTEYMEKAEFDEAFETVNTLIKEYIHLDMLHETPASCCPDSGLQSVRSAASVLTPSSWATSQSTPLSPRSIPSIRFELDTVDGGTFNIILDPQDFAEVKGSDCAFAFQPVDLPPNLGPMWVFGQTALRRDTGWWMG
ncbi:Tubulin epsilon chain (Epsilon-tubulin) [Durusdinium trenchii]|uniref:Tubulin epsilon chain (Epsilon-tubulin) n=1 Tax=Durusdinium trenchii TaxID=1381693 RepID=A0ABP0NHB2_9DINO